MASSRRQTTNYNHFLAVQTSLNSLYSQAIAFRLTHARILEQRSEIYASNSYRRLTTYYRGYIAGLDAGLMADIWRNHVIWMLGPASGPTRQVHTVWTEEMSTLSREKGSLYGGHYWTDDDGNPTDKVFTNYEVINA